MKVLELIQKLTRAYNEFGDYNIMLYYFDDHRRGDDGWPYGPTDLHLHIKDFIANKRCIGLRMVSRLSENTAIGDKIEST